MLSIIWAFRVLVFLTQNIKDHWSQIIITNMTIIKILKYCKNYQMWHRDTKWANSAGKKMAPIYLLKTRLPQTLTLWKMQNPQCAVKPSEIKGGMSVLEPVPKITEELSFSLKIEQCHSFRILKEKSWGAQICCQPEISKFSTQRTHLQSWLTHRLLGSLPEFLIQQFRDRAWEFKSQVPKWHWCCLLQTAILGPTATGLHRESLLCLLLWHYKLRGSVNKNNL